MYIASKLGKFPHEVEALPRQEIVRLIAYFKIEVMEKKRAQERAERVSRARSGANVRR